MMGRGFGGPGFGGPGFGPEAAAAGLWDAVDQWRQGFERRSRPRAGRGDVRAAVLALLLEEPMHGYQIIREIDERSGGAWKPSPGSVYPTLQMLVDEGAIGVEVADGRKTYSLTDAGNEEAQACASSGAPWESAGSGEHARASVLPKAGIELAHAAAQVGRAGTPEQIEEAAAVLDGARRQLYSILAQD